MNHTKDYFVARKGLEDGYQVIMHIMPAPEGNGFSRSNYHLMVRVDRNGKVLHNLVLTSQVKHPDGTVRITRTMPQVGAWYIARYNLSHEQGRHWLSVTFEHNGHRYETGTYYPEIDWRAN